MNPKLPNGSNGHNANRTSPSTSPQHPSLPRFFNHPPPQPSPPPHLQSHQPPPRPPPSPHTSSSSSSSPWEGMFDRIKHAMLGGVPDDEHHTIHTILHPSEAAADAAGRMMGRETHHDVPHPHPPSSAHHPHHPTSSMGPEELETPPRPTVPRPTKAVARAQLEQGGKASSAAARAKRMAEAEDEEAGGASTPLLTTGLEAPLHHLQHHLEELEGDLTQQIQQSAHTVMHPGAAAAEAAGRIMGKESYSHPTPSSPASVFHKAASPSHKDTTSPSS
jgi:hypothetical protein